MSGWWQGTVITLLDHTVQIKLMTSTLILCSTCVGTKTTLKVKELCNIEMMYGRHRGKT
jgi:hypothetical protein